MAMFSIKGKTAMSLIALGRTGLFVCLGAVALSACTQSTIRLSPDFGAAVRQDEAAQIADPDARYAGVPAPGANGARVGLAQQRYQKNQVIQPLDIGASNPNSISNPGNGSGNSGDNGGTPPTAGP